MLNFVLLEQVRMYSLHTAVHSGLSCARTELTCKGGPSVSGVKLLGLLIYVQGKAISAPLKPGLFWGDSNSISPYSSSSPLLYLIMRLGLVNVLCISSFCNPRIYRRIEHLNEHLMLNSSSECLVQSFFYF